MKYKVQTSGYVASIVIAKTKRRDDARDIAKALSLGYKSRQYSVYRKKCLDSVYESGMRISLTDLIPKTLARKTQQSGQKSE